MPAPSGDPLNIWRCCHTECFTRQNLHIWISACMSVIFAIKDIFFHKLRLLASIPPWWACGGAERGVYHVSVHSDLDGRGCAAFLWALKAKYLMNNDLQEENNTEEGEEDTEGYILAMEATRRWQRRWRLLIPSPSSEQYLFLKGGPDALSYSRKYSSYKEHCVKISCQSKQYKGQGTEKSVSNL